MEDHVCRCAFCVETRLLANEFDLFVAKTPLQKRMKTVIKRIEDRVKDSPPYEEGTRDKGFWYY
jgi:hypothetical protein